MSPAPLPQSTYPSRSTSAAAHGAGQKSPSSRGDTGHQLGNASRTEASRGGAMHKSLTEDESIFRELMDADSMFLPADDEMPFNSLIMSGTAQNFNEPSEATPSASSAPGVDMPRMINNITTSLVPHLQSATEQALEVSIHLPRLGRIRVNTQHDKSGWEMTLHAEDRGTRDMLAQHQTHCENALQQALGQNVCLHVSDKAPA